jgi:hypothetical protein
MVFRVLNEKANEELSAKLMTESHKLADRKTKKLHHEKIQVTEAISQLREEIRKTDTNK